MMNKKMSIKETEEAINRDKVAPHLIIYEITLVRMDEEGKCMAFTKSARFADHSAPSFWCCGHQHALWNEAVACTETPLSGAGDFLEPDRTEHSN